MLVLNSLFKRTCIISAAIFCIQAAKTGKAAHMERLYLCAGSSMVCNKYQNVREFAYLVNITGHNN